MKSELGETTGRELTDEYKARYEMVWQDDLGFSRKFMPEISDILGKVSFQDAVIHNNEGTKLDFQGSDLSILPSSPLRVGVRVRRNYAVGWDQFTQDDKERTTMSCDVYFLGYADEKAERLISYMIWDGNEYTVKRDSGTIPLAARKRNATHSKVFFNCYDNSEIAKNCRVYEKVGNVARNKKAAK